MIKHIQEAVVSRLLFLAFHCPKSYAWINAYYLAEQIFSVPYGSTICTTVLKAVNAACKSRNCGINYHDTNCEKCKEFLTDEEYYFIGTLHQIRQVWRSICTKHIQYRSGNKR